LKFHSSPDENILEDLIIERDFKKDCVICDKPSRRKESGCFFCLNDALCKDDECDDLDERNKKICMPMDDTLHGKVKEIDDV